MKALVLVTYTDCENKHRSLSSVGFETIVHQYDDRPHDQQGEIVEFAKSVDPDFIVFIGALEPYHTKPVLSPDILCRLREFKPLIHMCNDARDDPWWPMLMEYDRRECFTLQVSIDGSFENPIAGFKNGLLALTPTDWRPFFRHAKPWEERTIPCGFVGGIGHSTRHDHITSLIQSGHLNFMQGPDGRSYDEFAAVMGNIRAMPNFPYTGTNKFMHVKGRIVEAGLAGCCVIEHADAPTKHWFRPGLDYIEYRTVDDIREALASDAGILETMATIFQHRVLEKHHPRVFWKQVLEKAGFVLPRDFLVAPFAGAVEEAAQ